MIEAIKEENYLVIKIPAENLKQTILIDDKHHLIVEKQKIENLLNKIEDYKQDITGLKNCVFDILRLLGVFDENTGTIKETIKKGEESYFNHILKSLSEVVALLGQAQIPVIGKKAEAKLLQKFHFVKTIIPLIEKHGK